MRTSPSPPVAARATSREVFVRRRVRQVSVLFLVGKRRVAVATPRGARTYPREGVAYGFHMRWGVGPRFVLVLRVTGGRRDTVFTNLSPRGLYVVARRLDPLLRQDARSGAGVRTRF